MRIIAFITDPASIERILSHIGEPTTPPTIAAARAPPLPSDHLDQTPTYDIDAAEPVPDLDFDQTARPPIFPHSRHGAGASRFRPPHRHCAPARLGRALGPAILLLMTVAEAPTLASDGHWMSYPSHIRFRRST
jgi:hypothetical protein